MKVYLHTLGCRVNQYETDAVRRIFEENGWEIADRPEGADVCVVNTCTVTSEADRKSGQILRRMRKAAPGAVIAAMGCMSEMKDGTIDADIVLGTRDKSEILGRISDLMQGRAESFRGKVHSRPEVTKRDTYHEFGNVLSPEGVKAFVKVEDGCNKFCSYCIIPFARGRVASRDPQNVISEVRDLLARGYREIIVSGIHVCSYGRDRGEDIMSLLTLLESIAALPGLERLRLGSLEPMSLTPGFIEGLARMDCFCPHFHLSLQSGSDTVLRRMNRDYVTSEYMAKVDLIRSLFPDASVTTDVICGFPEETEEEHIETVRFVRQARLAKIHVFPYSLREGTAAASMKQVPGDVKTRRTREMLSVSSELSSSFAKAFAGRKVSVLAETCAPSGDGYVIGGYSREYVYSRVTSRTPAALGTSVEAYVTGTDEGTLVCRAED